MLYCKDCRIGYEAAILTCPRCGAPLVVDLSSPLPSREVGAAERRLLCPPTWLKVVIGACTFWPVVYMALFFVVVASAFVSAPHGGKEAFGPFAAFGYLFAVHMGTIFLSFALWAYYLLFALRTRRLSQDRRILWVVLTVVVGMFTMPVFYVLYVWSATPEAEGLAETAEVGGA